MKRSHGPLFLSRREISVSVTPIAEERIEQVCERCHWSRSRAVDALVRAGSVEDAAKVLDEDRWVVEAWRRNK